MKNSETKSYRVVGLMSGTSLDGLDIAYCLFWEENNKWRFKIPVAHTYDYPQIWKSRLRSAVSMSGQELVQLNNEYGRYLGELANTFILDNSLHPDLIASHGHTVFHQPEAGLTFQIGSGAEITAVTGITVVCDFRSQDVALGGQGAPLVPIGDKMLFGEFDFCLNLGGFSNISFEEDDVRKAFDICPVNIALNYLSQKLGVEFDKDGALASSGTFCSNLFNALNDLPFYAVEGPKSLGWEWLQAQFLPLLDDDNSPVKDKLRTTIEHIAYQISLKTNKISDGKILVTGGGAFNKFLINRIGDLNNNTLIIPEDKIINFKEALIFAFLGLLRYLNKPNCLASVTAATTDHSSGAIYSL